MSRAQRVRDCRLAYRFVVGHSVEAVDQRHSGSIVISSASVGLRVSRSDSTGRSSGHRMASVGSFHAIPISAAGS